MPAAKAKGKGRRVLVVDDNQDAADSLAMLLGVRGEEVRIAYDGAKALDVERDFKPDVILLDIGLPALSGYDVAERVREKRGAKVLIVAITGWGQEKDLRRAEDAGIDHHFTKPVDFEALVALIERAAPSRRPA
ncbi:MAG TPA: response regulator [Usitatibacter sp.]|jgi:DNA-binding response OmpR family regulator|nr:response regulator [Usitatibacter sp.]